MKKLLGIAVVIFGIAAVQAQESDQGNKTSVRNGKARPVVAFVVQWRREFDVPGGQALSLGANDENNVAYYVNGESAGKGQKGCDEIVRRIGDNGGCWFFYSKPALSQDGPTWANLPDLLGRNWKQAVEASLKGDAYLLIASKLDVEASNVDKVKLLPQEKEDR